MRPLRQGVRAVPAWLHVLCFVLPAALPSLVLDGTAAWIVLLCMFALFALTLIPRGGDEAWAIVGMGVIVNLLLKALPLPHGIEYALWVALWTGLAYWLIDSEHAQGDPRGADGRA